HPLRPKHVDVDGTFQNRPRVRATRFGLRSPLSATPGAAGTTPRCWRYARVPGAEARLARSTRRRIPGRSSDRGGDSHEGAGKVGVMGGGGVQPAKVGVG